NSRADAIIKESHGKKPFSNRLVMAAYNGKGGADLNGGDGREALLDAPEGAMVRTSAETSHNHESALARSAIACAKVAGAEKDAAKKGIYKGRAQEMFGELTRTYGANTKFKAGGGKA